MADSNTSLTLHGVFMDVMHVGVLLIGDSGIGKSETALGLINYGHGLVADDAIQFDVVNNKVVGSCPPMLRDFLEVRGLGIINIRKMFGGHAITKKKRLELIVKMISVDNDSLRDIDRLHGVHRQCDILGHNIPEVTIPVAPGRNLAILVEAAVRNQLLKDSGYDATAELMGRQRNLSENG